ncbi:MAG: flagellar hook assembly protein FlgD [Pseudobdellovibrionaceae bacterium]
MSAISVKTGTNAFGKSQGAGPVSQTDKVQTMSANDTAKIGDEAVGDKLNRIADSNWVDPDKKMRATGNNEMGKDAFFKLMLTQMKHQDPTNPLKSHEMAAQLAQFTSLEQLQNMNSTLEEMRAGQKPAEGFQALNFIGKSIAGDSSKLIRADEKSTHDFRFDLPADAANVEIKVRNPQNEIVRTFKLEALKSGENKINWNGESEQGVTQGVGEYTFAIEAKDANGKKLNVKTDFQGTVSGVNYTAEGPILLVGEKTVRLADVKKIVDPSIKSNDQKLKNLNESPNQDLKQDGKKQETKSVAPASAPIVNNLGEGVAMTNGMKNKLEKEL